MNTRESRTRLFFDFDHTLYDTALPVELVNQALMERGYPAEAVRSSMKQSESVGYSFEDHLRLLEVPHEEHAELVVEFQRFQDQGDGFLYPDVLEGIKTLSGMADCSLLTFGYPRFQQRKFAGTPSLHPYLHNNAFVWKNVTKGDVIRDCGSDTNAWFLDDSAQHLLDVQQKAPWTRCVRMERNKSLARRDGDTTLWPVVQTLQMFIQLVKEGF